MPGDFNHCQGEQPYEDDGVVEKIADRCENPVEDNSGYCADHNSNLSHHYYIELHLEVNCASESRS